MGIGIVVETWVARHVGVVSENDRLIWVDCIRMSEDHLGMCPAGNDCAMYQVLIVNIRGHRTLYSVQILLYHVLLYNLFNFYFENVIKRSEHLLKVWRSHIGWCYFTTKNKNISETTIVLPTTVDQQLNYNINHL